MNCTENIFIHTSCWRVDALGSGLIFIPVLSPSCVSSVVEHLPGKQSVEGSTPLRSVSFSADFTWSKLYIYIWDNVLYTQYMSIYTMYNKFMHI